MPPGQQTTTSLPSFRRGYSSHLEHYERSVVGKRRAVRKPIYVIKHTVDQLGRSAFVMLFDDLAQTLHPEKLSLAVCGFSDSVGMEHENIAGFERDAPLIIGDVFKNPEWKSSELDLAATAILIKQRLRLSGIGDAQLASALLPRCKTRRHEAAFDAPLPDDLIHLSQHFGRLQFLRRKAAHDSDRNRSIKRSRGAFPAHVTECDSQLLRSISQKFVEVAAKFARRQIPRRHIQSVFFGGRHRPQQRALNSLRRLKITVETRFIARYFLVKPGVFERHRKIRRENRERLHMVFGEVVKLRALEIKHADHTPLMHHRDRELGARLRI